MGISTFPSVSAKTRYLTTLLSGTSWTVPAGVTYVNVTLRGGGGSGADDSAVVPISGNPGQVVSSTLATTPGASITYAIGAGGAAVSAGNSGNPGGTTTFTGATSAVGGTAGTVSTNAANAATAGQGASNGGTGQKGAASSAGGQGSIDLEWWA